MGVIIQSILRASLFATSVSAGTKIFDDDIEMGMKNNSFWTLAGHFSSPGTLTFVRIQDGTESDETVMDCDGQFIVTEVTAEGQSFNLKFSEACTCSLIITEHGGVY